MLEKGTMLKRKVIITLLMVPVLVGALLFVQLAFFPWSPVNCWTYEVDINSGQIRYTRHLLFLPVRKTVEDSTLSRALSKDDFFAPTPSWYRVLALSPGVRHSPHYIFHSAMNQIRELEMIWETGRFTPAARRASAKRVLALWQEGKSDDTAKNYIRALAGLGFSSNEKDQITDEKDLPKL